MSERETNPEQQKPLTDKCRNCKVKYPINEETSIARLFETQEECNHVLCTCPNCDFKTKIFGNMDYMQRVVDAGARIEYERNADELTYNQWLGLKGIQLAQTYELTPRHELLVSVMAETLQNCPDDLLYDLITADNEQKPYPERWN